MKPEEAREYSESLAQIGDGWWRQLVWAVQQGVPKAVGMTVDEWRSTYYAHLRLPVIERKEAVAELTTDGMTQRDIAAILGVHHVTVGRDLGANAPDVQPNDEGDGSALGANAPDVQPNDEESPIDRAPWMALQSVADSIGSFATTYDVTTIALAVPARRRAATAKRLRNLGRDLGRVAVALEQMEKS